MKLIASGAILSLMIGCGGSSGPSTNNAVSHIGSSSNVDSITTTTPYVKKRLPRMEGEPSTLRRFALATNGKLTVKQTLFTDGPLADIYVNQSISAPTRSLDISGKIIAKNQDELQGSITRSFHYENNKEIESTTAVRALKVSEFITNNNLTNYFSLSLDGKLSEVIDGKATSLSSIEGLDATYANGTWTISGGDVSVNGDLKVDGNLIINTDKIFIAGALMVSGDLSAKGELNINTGTPFDSALVVDKNINVDKLVTIGRVHASGTFTSNVVEITGNVEIDGDITLNGDATINMLDNVYKSALADAQEESEQKNKNLTLAHSQLFKDLKGNNSIVLFTFVDGNYLLNENIINELITSKESNDFNFTSSLYGASIKYVSQLSKTDYLSNFYENLLLVKKVLSKTYGVVKVKKYIDIAPSNLYCQFIDQNNQDIGTYLISSIAHGKISTLIPLTDTQRDRAIERLEQPDKINESIADARIEDSNATNSDILQNASSEYLELDSNISTAIASTDKKAIESEDKAARINEWVEYQELGSTKEVVEVEEIVITKKDSIAKQRGWFSRAWKRVKRVFRKFTLTDCHKKREHGEIRGVNENQTNMLNRNDSAWGTDDWTKFVTLNNNTNYCTPTAAAMILQYHAKVHYNKKSFYNNDNEEGYNSLTNSYVAQWASYLHSSTESGTNAWNTFLRLPYRVYIQARDNEMSWGWAYSYYTSVWNRAWQFRIMKWYLNRNRPGIYHAPTYTITWNSNSNRSVNQDVYHSMPIIGWKTESYGGWCAKKIWPNKNWFLLDTEFGFKQYVRFDSRSRYWKIGAISYIWVQ